MNGMRKESYSMKIKKFMTPEMYVERVEGSEEWYLGVAFEEDV